MLASYHTNEYVAVEFLGGEEVTHQLKQRVADKLSLSTQSCDLVYNGSKLSNAATLASVGVTEGCLVIVFLSGTDEGSDLLGGYVTKYPASNEPQFLKSEIGDFLDNQAAEVLGQSVRKMLKVTVKYRGQDLVLSQLDPNTRIIAVKELLRLKLAIPVESQELTNGLRMAENTTALTEFSGGEGGLVFRLKVKKS